MLQHLKTQAKVQYVWPQTSVRVVYSDLDCPVNKIEGSIIQTAAMMVIVMGGLNLFIDHGRCCIFIQYSIKWKAVMAKSNNVIKLRPKSLEDEALQLLHDRLEFTRKMLAGELTNRQIVSTEAKLQADMLYVAKQYGL